MEGSFMVEYMLINEKYKISIQVRELKKSSSILLLCNTKTKAIEERIVSFKNPCHCHAYFSGHTGFKGGAVIVSSRVTD